MCPWRNRLSASHYLPLCQDCTRPPEVFRLLDLRLGDMESFAELNAKRNRLLSRTTLVIFIQKWVGVPSTNNPILPEAKVPFYLLWWIGLLDNFFSKKCIWYHFTVWLPMTTNTQYHAPIICAVVSGTVCNYFRYFHHLEHYRLQKWDEQPWPTHCHVYYVISWHHEWFLCIWCKDSI